MEGWLLEQAAGCPPQHVGDAKGNAQKKVIPPSPRPSRPDRGEGENFKLLKLTAPGHDLTTHIIIGNGVAGNAAAEAIRQHDQDGAISIFSREEYPFLLCPGAAGLYRRGEG